MRKFKELISRIFRRKPKRTQWPSECLIGAAVLGAIGGIFFLYYRHKSAIEAGYKVLAESAKGGA